MDKEHKDPDTIDLEAPRLAQYMHKNMEETSKYGILGRHQPCSEGRIGVPIKHDRSLPSFTKSLQLQAYCFGINIKL